MGGRGASFAGTYTGSRYGTQYSAEEVLMFNEMQDELGIQHDNSTQDRDLLDLMLSRYDSYRNSWTEELAAHNVIREWNENIQSELQAQGTFVNTENFIASPDDYKTFTDMYREVTAYNKAQPNNIERIDSATMNKTTKNNTIVYESNGNEVVRNNKTGEYTVRQNTWDDNAPTQSFQSLSAAMDWAKKNQGVSLPF